MPRPQQQKTHDTISASTDSTVPQVPQRSAWTSSGWSVITTRRTCSCSGPRLAKHYRLGGNLGRIRSSNANGLGDACGRPLSDIPYFRARMAAAYPLLTDRSSRGLSRKTSRIVDRWPASRVSEAAGIWYVCRRLGRVRGEDWWMVISSPHNAGISKMAAERRSRLEPTTAPRRPRPRSGEMSGRVSAFPRPASLGISSVGIS